MSGSIRVDNLCYHYPDGTPALRDVSFTIDPGECVGVIGPNGAGKSTLLLHLNGLLPDQSHAQGAVHIDGERITRANLHAVRRKVGVVFQDPDDQLFCPTVFEDVAFGPRQFGLAPDRLKQTIADALAKVGLSGAERRAPHHLSGGEKRRVCLAGVLACDPGILVLDEPTSNLDPRGRREFKSLLKELPATKVIATHDLEMVVELCSRTILLDRGQVVAAGPTVKLLSDEPLMLAHGLERPHILLHRHPHPPMMDNSSFPLECATWTTTGCSNSS
ncbi:MAG TPA: ABC transporter ATP-binding protein [Tepidisphaeraceae bacterium]|jgi:cobalt transport protein ATP-binding subunit